MKETIGLIGLGLVGSALAERFRAAGFGLVGYDVDAGKMRALADLGVAAAGSPCEVARRVRRIVLSLPNSHVVEEVVEGADGILAGARRETVIIDTTTGDPERTTGLAARLRERSIVYVDAAISGSSATIREGKAVVLAGGDAKVIGDQQGLFAAFATRVFAMGPNGKGAEAKLVVNLVLGLNRLALAEGLALGLRAGMPPETLLEVLRASAAYSRVMDTKGKKMVAGDFSTEGRLSQHLKDVKLILELGKRLKALLPMSALHAQLLEKTVEAGYGDSDHSAIIRAFLNG
jgi:3-hydroxyisobutyrate dehydrogenase-like beta-hydroxyacid dehydrogenase